MSTRFSQMSRRLLTWFDAHKRDLPWRKAYNPYEVWISEIMLQQTQVKTMLPYYRRWMERFPDIPSVAEASEGEILKHWEGLGYYSRALNIRKTARVLMHELDGAFPREHRTLLKLPGIGPYTAGAIMSLAFNEPYAVVDGNVERVFARVFDLSRPVKEKESRDFIWQTARNLIPEGRARELNQALMELGALVCLPKNPLCPHCPLTGFCESRRRGTVHLRPVPAKRKAVTAIEVAVGILVSRDRVLIQKRPPSGLMGGLWEFPGGKVREGETPDKALMRELKEELELKVTPSREIATLRHNYTSFRVTLHAFFCISDHGCRLPVLRAAEEARWVTTQELDDYAFPAANRKLIRIIQKKGLPETL
jgi:A/G-specific adenine glycosylase